MPSYRRNYFGNIFFLTIVTYDRRSLFDRPDARRMLHDAIALTQQERPWITDAIVLLPEHMHMLWRMPSDDTDYSMRIAIIKKRFTRAILSVDLSEPIMTRGQAWHGRRAVWQERFREYTIRDAKDYRLHVDYIHRNPVKHGLVSKPRDWPYSSFRDWVSRGYYEEDWCGRLDVPGYTEYGWPD